MAYSLTCVKLNIVRDELNLVRTSINQIIEAKVLVDEVLASSQANVQSLRKQIPYFNRIFIVRDGDAVFFTYVSD